MVSEIKTCPVCGGNGLVQKGFYNQVSGSWTSGTTAFEQCRSCYGTGYIIVPDNIFSINEEEE